MSRIQIDYAYYVMTQRLMFICNEHLFVCRLIQSYMVYSLPITITVICTGVSQVNGNKVKMMIFLMIIVINLTSILFNILNHSVMRKDSLSQNRYVLIRSLSTFRTP